MLTIGQFSKISQIPSKTLRYYDEIGLLKPQRVDAINGYRYYDTTQLGVTLKILKLKAFDFTLDEIKNVLEDETQLVPLLDNKKIEIGVKLTDYTSIKKSIEKYLKELSQGGSIMEKIDTSKVKVVTSPSLHLLSVREFINIANFDSLFQKAFNFLNSNQQVPIGAPVTLYHSEEFNPEHYDVELGFPIADKNRSNHTLEATECAYVEYVGEYKNLNEAYAMLAQWLEDNNYEINGVPFEQYVTDPAVTKPEENQVNVYMPITKKEHL